MRDQPALLQFNRGKISKLALARIDLKRTAISAEIQTNWMPRALGPMGLRPGLGYIDTLAGKTLPIPFVFAADDTAIIQVQDETVSVVVDDVLLTRPTVTAAFTNGGFATNFSGWTSVDAGTVNAWQTGGYAGLAGDGTDIASLQQEVTVNEPGTEHGIRIIVQRGPVQVRIGTTVNTFDLLEDTTLNTGSHSFAITPAGSSFFLKFFNQNPRLALIDSVAVETGDVYLAAPWPEDSPLRWDQSGDIVFIACAGYQQRRILRRSDRSWSIDVYAPEDGPFRVENTSTTTLTPSAISGNITVTSSAVASDGIFKATNVGSLYSLTSVGQTVTESITAQNTFSGAILVTGITTGRTFAVVITGTFSATVSLQRSFDGGSTWQDTGTTYTAAASTTFTDALDNQIINYRIGVKTGDYTSGTAVCTLTYSAGSITGVFRVTAFSSTTSVSAEVLTDLGGTAASDTWAEGDWSSRRGFPSAVAFHEGRLWWAGKDKFWGSITDAFDSHDPNFLGDAGPISRSIGSGPVDTINWLIALQRLLAGTGGSVVSCRSSSFDEPLTPRNFNPKIPTTQGTANVAAVKVDDSAIFVQQNGARVFEMASNPQANDYGPTDLTELIPEIGKPGIIQIAVQRQPDTRVHCVRSDGTVGLLVFNKAENVVCWVDVETDGLVESVCVLPGTEEDRVYYCVKRTLANASTARYLEKWALESECEGGELNLQADSYVTGAGTATLALSHLNGLEVVAWGDGVNLGTFTASASTDLGAVYTTVVAGLTYQARFKSAKLAHASPRGYVGLSVPKRIHQIGLILSNTHAKGLRFGQDFDTMNELPDIENFAAVDQNSVWEQYDKEFIPMPGDWDTDTRLCLEANAPKPCTVLAAILDVMT